MTLSAQVHSRIQQLPPSVVNKIAAGEVIERPASVVKELLENSVDALATRIEVDILQGGAEQVRVTDDGEGMHPEDVLLAVAAHATSKIADADDLFHVHTLGFRGEALASIAEVSKLLIRTRTADQEAGVELEVDGGTVGEPRVCGMPPGTQIDVRGLFFNTPARRKFLKTQATEFAHISEQFTRIALAHPRLHLALRHQSRTVYELPATDRLADRIALFFGGELAEGLIPVESVHDGIRLWGFVAHPKLSKSTRKGQYLFLNGRWIQDRSLQHALTEAYRGLLMVGRQPISFLFLEVPPDEVDVNVHPTKSEVRLQDGQRLYRQVLSTLRTKFLSSDLDSEIDARRFPEQEGHQTADPERQQAVQQELVTWAKHELANWKPKEDLSDLEAALAELDRREDERNQRTESSVPGALTGGDFEIPSEVGAGPSVVHAPTGEAEARPASASAEVRAMQVHDCYLVVESGDGLTVIDQHALHERILYERFRRRVLEGKVEVQRLLTPITVELSAREAGQLLDQRELLAELGLHVEEFGGQTISLTGYPTMLARAAPETLLRAVVEHLETTGQKTTRRDLLDSLLHMMACKAAIKAGQRLSPEEIESLLALRHLVDDHHHCPHGRPTALTLSRAELDRQFGRLG